MQFLSSWANTNCRGHGQWWQRTTLGWPNSCTLRCSGERGGKEQGGQTCILLMCLFPSFPTRAGKQLWVILGAELFLRESQVLCSKEQVWYEFPGPQHLSNFRKLKPKFKLHSCPAFIRHPLPAVVTHFEWGYAVASQVRAPVWCNYALSVEKILFYFATSWKLSPSLTSVIFLCAVFKTCDRRQWIRKAEWQSWFLGAEIFSGIQSSSNYRYFSVLFLG